MYQGYSNLESGSRVGTQASQMRTGTNIENLGIVALVLVLWEVSNPEQMRRKCTNQL